MNGDRLPGWAMKFLKGVCPDYLVEEIEGDLVQKYQFDVGHYGLKRANRKLLWNILSFLRPGIFMRKRFSVQLNQWMMIRNYLVTAVRVSVRQRMNTVINVLGLSVGLASSLLIGIYIFDELSYDRHIKDADRIYRVGINETFKGDEILYANSGSPLADALRHDLPEIEDAVRVRNAEMQLRYNDKAFVEKGMMAADSNFFEFFGFDMTEGNRHTALKGPQKIVLSVSSAKKYFAYDGSESTSPVGKQMIFGEGQRVAEVTGIFADVPQNTHMKFDIMMSIESFGVASSDCWGCYNVKTYFKTVKGTNTESIEKKLSDYAEKQIIAEIEKDLNISHDEFVKSGDRVSFFLHPLLSIHLESNLVGDFEPNGDLRYVYIFGVIGIFLVVIACINFMNLSTARAISRGKEVGVRKTMGATRRGLVPQFMIESFLYVFVSGVFAVVIACGLLRPFNLLSGKNLHILSLNTPGMWLAILLVLVAVGILAGSYPAFYLTSFKPVAVLKGGSVQGTSRSFLRSSLVVFQFTISMILIIGTMIVHKQVQFIQNQSLGFKKENILRIPQAYVLNENSQSFKNELLNHSEFSEVSYAEFLPPNVRSTSFVRDEHSDQLIGYYNNGADYDFVKTLGLEMKSGRYFSREFLSDSTAVVMNEACAKLLGYETHEGKRVNFGDQKQWNVIGIMKNFNFASLKSDVHPMVMFLDQTVNRTIAIRVAPGDISSKVKLVESIWKKYANGQPFEYAFVDEDFDSLFRAEQRLGVVFAIFTGMAIFIACLGLFGLITYIAGQRTKEIGIRKVLGATRTQITVLLLSDLVRLVIISFVIAVPLAWYGMDQWLQSFAYRTNFDAFSVIIAGVAGLLIAVLTVGYRSLKAASANPADSLKNE